MCAYRSCAIIAHVLLLHTEVKRWIGDFSYGSCDTLTHVRVSLMCVYRSCACIAHVRVSLMCAYCSCAPFCHTSSTFSESNSEMRPPVETPRTKSPRLRTAKMPSKPSVVRTGCDATLSVCLAVRVISRRGSETSPVEGVRGLRSA